MAKNTEKEIEDVQEEAEVSGSAKERRAAFQRIIDAYKAANPVKYEAKKEELERKLAAIK